MQSYAPAAAKCCHALSRIARADIHSADISSVATGDGNTPQTRPSPFNSSCRRIWTVTRRRFSKQRGSAFVKCAECAARAEYWVLRRDVRGYFLPMSVLFVFRGHSWVATVSRYSARVCKFEPESDRLKWRRNLERYSTVSRSLR